MQFVGQPTYLVGGLSRGCFRFGCLALSESIKARSMKKSIRAVAFVLRCSGAAIVAYEVVFSLELLWAAMSAVIVSQERLHETRSSLAGRILGTLLGIGVTVAASEITSRTTTSTAVQVAICALVVRELPKLRVAMWTCPIILLTAQPSTPMLLVALHRGSEVILGAIVGWIFHWFAEVVVDALPDAESDLRCGPASRQERIQPIEQDRVER
jgi:uncharacterized membrane protein YccC